MPVTVFIYSKVITMNKILVIDDDLDLLAVLKEWFSDESFELRTLSRANGVFDIIEQFRPDLILIDYLLTDINGGEICSQIKRSTEYAHIPIAILSAYPKVFLSLGNYKCDLFIAKPFDLYSLTEKIQGLLNLPVD